MDPEEERVRKGFPLETRVAVMEAQMRHVEANIANFKKDHDDLSTMKTTLRLVGVLLAMSLTAISILVAIIGLIAPHIVFK